MSAKGDYYPLGPNMWVKNMTYAADMNGLDGKPYVDLGVLDAKSTTFFANLSTAWAGGAVTVTSFANSSTLAQMGKFGRGLQIVAGGASTVVMSFRGYDYLGQPMQENITLNGTTPVLGLKAFRYLVSATSAGAVANLSVGTTDVLGLPYATVGDQQTYTDTVKDASAGTIAVYVATQTATSGDPRGTWTPHSSVIPNGSRRTTLTYEPLRGNLYGNAHFFS